MLNERALCQRTVDQLRHFRRTGEDHALDPCIAGEPGADDVAAAWQQLQRAARNSGLVKQFDRAMCNQRGLLGRFGQHDVTGRQRRGDLACEDREREVPGTDAGHRSKCEQVDGAVHLRCVIAQEVDRFANFGNRVGQRLAGLAHGQRHQLVVVFFEQIGHARDEDRAFRRGRRLPVHRVGAGAFKRAVDLFGARLGHAADDVVVRCRVGNSLPVDAGRWRVDQRGRLVVAMLAK